MIRFTRPGCSGPIEYAIKFTYNTKTELRQGKKLSPSPEIVERETIAEIVYPGRADRPGDVVIASGRAVCTPPCNFDRNVGRKMALKRALEKIKFPRDVRKQVWESYFAARGKPY